MSAPAPTLPEVRQCTDDTSEHYGETATAGQGRMVGLWLVVVPSGGGHWGDDAEVEGWTVIVTPAEPPVKAEK